MTRQREETRGDECRAERVRGGMAAGGRAHPQRTHSISHTSLSFSRKYCRSHLTLQSVLGSFVFTSHAQHSHSNDTDARGLLYDIPYQASRSIERQTWENTISLLSLHVSLALFYVSFNSYIYLM